MSKRNAMLLLLLALLTWKLVRTDWIVSTNYWYYDADPPPSESIEVRTYIPPITPLWRPPRPQDIEPTATSWRDWEFFYTGGTGGPTEEKRDLLERCSTRKPNEMDDHSATTNEMTSLQKLEHLDADNQ